VTGVDVTIDIPGGHGRMHFPGDCWPPLEILVEQAEAGAAAFRHCPDCRDVPVSEILAAMARAAPAELAADLRELAGVRPEPGQAEHALADLYRQHADGLAALDAAYADRSWMTKP
jgi:hypothetical protein